MKLSVWREKSRFCKEYSVKNSLLQLFSLNSCIWSCLFFPIPNFGSSHGQTPEQTLTQDDTIAICFRNERGRGHAETVGIQEIAAYFRFGVAAMLTYDKAAAQEWRYCVSCEMAMPPIHACSATTPT